jgi:hypothetical protein
MTLLGNSTFEGTFYFSQSRKVVDFPHREEKNGLVFGIFPHFLNFPTESFIVHTADLSALGRVPAIQMKKLICIFAPTRWRLAITLQVGL